MEVICDDIVDLIIQSDSKMVAVKEEDGLLCKNRMTLEIKKEKKSTN